MFRAVLWSEETSDSEKDLDVDSLDLCMGFEDSRVKVNKKREEIEDILSGRPNLVSNVNATRDKWQYIFPNRDHADVKEVWFAGDLIVYSVSTITHNGNWQYNLQVRMETLGEAPVFLRAILVYRSYPCAG